MCGTAAAASSRSTVMRTISEPARASAATCATVDATSAVSVLVIDCTTTGAPPPTVTPPTSTATDWRRSCGPASFIVTPVLLTSARAPGCRQLRMRAARHTSRSLSSRCVHTPLISITGDFGVKPTARAADLNVVATSVDDASPTAPQRSQIRNSTRSPWRGRARRPRTRCGSRSGARSPARAGTPARGRS